MLVFSMTFQRVFHSFLILRVSQTGYSQSSISVSSFAWAERCVASHCSAIDNAGFDRHSMRSITMAIGDICFTDVYLFYFIIHE